MARPIIASVKYVKSTNQLDHQEVKLIIANVEYINSKSRKYFWAISESCLLNEFIN